MAAWVRYVDAGSSAGGDGTTNATSGANRAYASLNEAEAAMPADITTGASQGVASITCAGSTADTTAVVFVGTTTSSTYYILVQAGTSDRAAMAWATGRYRLEPNDNAGILLDVQDNHVRLEGLQIGKATDGGAVVVRFAAQSADNDLRMSACAVRGQGGTTNAYPGVWVTDADAVFKMWNCLIYNIAQKASSVACCLQVSAATSVNLYSSVFQGGYRALSGVFTAKNCYAVSQSTNYYGTPTHTTCASADTSGDTGLQSIAYDTSTGAGHAGFTNVTAGSQDFTLKTGSALLDVGTDTSGDSAPLNFTTDILGTARPQNSVWDIGAFELVVAAGGLLMPIAMHHYKMMRG